MRDLCPREDTAPTPPGGEAGLGSLGGDPGISVAGHHSKLGHVATGQPSPLPVTGPPCELPGRPVPHVLTSCCWTRRCEKVSCDAHPSTQRETTLCAGQGWPGCRDPRWLPPSPRLMAPPGQAGEIMSMRVPGALRSAPTSELWRLPCC